MTTAGLHESLIGRCYGEWAVEGYLAAGAMGKVYRVRNIFVDNLVGALKLLPPDANDDEIRRFRREGNAISALQCPNTVRLKTFNARGVDWYLVMEFIDGRTLEEVLAGGPLTSRRVAELAYQVCASLREAHEYPRGRIIHRDIKPGNLFFDEASQRPAGIEHFTDFVRVVDFGLAHIAGGGGNKTAAIGTPCYMPPEQWDGKPEERSDIYALGVVLFEALTGTNPFDVDSVGQCCRLHQTLLPTFPTDGPAIDEALAALVSKMVAKSPEDRPESARKIQQALVDAGLVGGVAPGLSDPPVVQAPPSRQPAQEPEVTPETGPDVAEAPLVAPATYVSLPFAKPTHQLPRHLDRSPSGGRIRSALLVAAIAAGAVTLLWVTRDVWVPAPGGGETEAKRPTPTTSRADLLAKAESALGDLRWTDAQRASNRLLQTNANDADAKRVLAHAKREMENEKRVQEARTAIDGQHWTSAIQALFRFPENSAYHSKLPELHEALVAAVRKSEPDPQSLRTSARWIERQQNGGPAKAAEVIHWTAVAFPEDDDLAGEACKRMTELGQVKRAQQHCGRWMGHEPKWSPPWKKKRRLMKAMKRPPP